MKKILFAMMFAAMASAPLFAATRPAHVAAKAASSKAAPKKPAVPVKVYKSNRKLAQERRAQ